MNNWDSFDKTNVVSNKASKVSNFEKPLLTWFCNMHQAGKHIDGKLLKAGLRPMIGVSEQMKDVTSDSVSS